MSTTSKAAEENEFAGEPHKKGIARSIRTFFLNRKKLARDQSNKILGGVCSGLAHYFSIDPVWTRLIFALLALGYGTGLLIYVVL